MLWRKEKSGKEGGLVEVGCALKKSRPLLLIRLGFLQEVWNALFSPFHFFLHITFVPCIWLFFLSGAVKLNLKKNYEAHLIISRFCWTIKLASTALLLNISFHNVVSLSRTSSKVCASFGWTVMVERKPDVGRPTHTFSFSQA